jgi:hypothetical protein
MQSVNFHVGAGVTGLSGLAAWSVDNATGAGPRVVGVNIDIFDSANQLVVSDAFVSSQGGFASSMFSSTAWTEGDYRLVARGTAVRDAMFDLALTFDGIAQGAPSVSSGGCLFKDRTRPSRRPTSGSCRTPAPSPQASWRATRCWSTRS